MHDDRTPRGWPLPHAENYLEDDVARLREALTAADSDLTAMKTEIDAKDEADAAALKVALSLKADEAAMLVALALKTDKTTMDEALTTLGLKADKVELEAHDNSDGAHKLTAAQWLLLRSLVLTTEDVGKLLCIKLDPQGNLVLGTRKGLEMVVFKEPGTHQWQIPHGISEIYMTMCGGGGGGAGGVSANGSYTTYSGSGGGGGGASIKKIQVVSPDMYGTTIAVTVGAGGSGGLKQHIDQANQAKGGTGGTSSFGSFFSVSGGAGGEHDSGGVGGIGDVNGSQGVKGPSKGYANQVPVGYTIIGGAGGVSGLRNSCMDVEAVLETVGFYGVGGKGGNLIGKSGGTVSESGDPGNPGIVIIQYL